MEWVLCWHRAGKAKGNVLLCSHCGVAVEECPCVSYRVPNDTCQICDGSGYVAIVRGKASKFAEYLRHDGT